MVRFLLPFCLGIAFPLNVHPGISLPILWGLLLLLVYLSRKRQGVLRKLRFKFLLLLVNWGAAMQLALPENFNADTEPKIGFGLLEVLPEPVLREGKFRFDARILAHFENGNWARAQTKLRVYLTPGSKMEVRTGDVLVCRIEPKSPPDARFPGAFSMKDWLAGRQIRSLISLDSSNCESSGLRRNVMQSELIELRKAMIKRLSDAGLRQRELAVAGALILGDRSEIDQELVNDFTASGLVHILAVSGMHVGLIYGAWILILGLILPRNIAFIGIVSAIPMIWTYAILTGLSDSVIRATVMYSILAIASIRKMPTSPFNTLAAAAFLMLLHDPGIYKQAGFQLSFAAVWGITAAQPILRSCEAIRSKLFRMLAVSGLVTLAAQLATAPLGFYHFGSFPVYFFIANLVAVPLATILTYWGIAATLLAPVPWLGVYMVKFLGWGIGLLNALAHQIQLLPHARISGYYIGKWEFVLALVLLLQLSWLLMNPGLRRFRYVLCFALILSVFSFASEMLNGIQGGYLAARKGQQLDIVLVDKTRAVHIRMGISTPKPDDREVKPALGKKFRISECAGHFLFTSPELVFLPVKSYQQTNWVRNGEFR